ncbi:integrating conjugative element protein [Billgrantia montanilacus]|uniref:Integrating conjugative element protein n=1 Tax=Billgrantia montanilacus TaxID=2282305 RepID=A0A368TUT5_9GAMM|nr:integrating conjugative element protein [Halomonas montanilacus]RCV86903.1 integrating conjugative element protein [Halomonas montanilacus]
MKTPLIAMVGLVASTAVLSGHAQQPPRPPGLPELTVVADRGGEPARPYYVAIGMAGVDEEDGYVSEPSAPVSIGERDMLPVDSGTLSPGRVQPRSLDLPPGMTPFFLVGADDLSVEWLKQRRAILREMNAVGLVVQVSDLEKLEQLRAVGQGLELRPVSADDLAGRLGLSHYPVLITADIIEQ